MTESQSMWAETHDWFIFAFEELDGSWSVVVKDATEEDENNRTIFSNFRKLKAWAGY